MALLNGHSVVESTITTTTDVSSLVPTTATTNKPDSVKRSHLIRRQLEFYLSPTNLSRDAFFGHEAKKRPDQGIPIDLLLNCHRLKRLGTSRKAIVKAVGKSNLLSLSSDGLAVLPNLNQFTNLGPREKRTVLLVGIPVGWFEQPGKNSTSENQLQRDVKWRIESWLRSSLELYGDILYVQIPCFHSSSVPRGFAFVEFAKAESAKAVCKSIVPRIDLEAWFTPPLTDSSTVDQQPTKHCPETAWQPQLALEASLTAKHMLARRYVWRCCSRKNKRIVGAFRRLLQAGYQGPNPCEREYECIIIGESSDSTRHKYYHEDRQREPQLDRLCALSHSQWRFWQAKFYTWLSQWVELLHSMALDQSLLVNASQLIDQNVEVNEEGEEAVPPLAFTNDTLRQLPEGLPHDYVPGSVVQIYWPDSLVAVQPVAPMPTGPGAPIDSDPDELLTCLKTKRSNLSLARRLRIGLERHLFHPRQLLDQLVHVDPSPTLQTWDQVSYCETKEPSNSSPWLDQLNAVASQSSTDSYHPVFVRLLSRQSARRLTEDTTENTEIDDQPKWLTRRLTGEAELVYCRLLVDSLIGNRERRRRTQQRRRGRTKKESTTDTVNNRHIQSTVIQNTGVQPTHKHFTDDD